MCAPAVKSLPPVEAWRVERCGGVVTCSVPVEAWTPTWCGAVDVSAESHIATRRRCPRLHISARASLLTGWCTLAAGRRGRALS